MRAPALFALAVLLPACAAAAPPASAPRPAEGALSAAILGADGRKIGAAWLADAAGRGLLLRGAVGAGGLAPGWHGLHLHEAGDCSDIGVYKASGGHVGHGGKPHGLLNPDGPEPGDLPNIWAHGDGSAGFEAYTGLMTRGDLGADGVALIIHAAPDDHASQPIGGAGARLACAAFAAPTG